jgi:hypothetical protein
MKAQVLTKVAPGLGLHEVLNTMLFDAAQDVRCDQAANKVVAKLSCVRCYSALRTMIPFRF